MIVPIKGRATGAQSLRGARRGDRTIQARGEIKGRAFVGIGETHVWVSEVTHGRCAGFRSGWTHEEIWHARMHGKVCVENVAERRVEIGDEPVRVPAALVGFRPGEAALFNGALGCAGRRGLSRRGCHEHECADERQQRTLNAMKFHSSLPPWSYFTLRLAAGMGIHNGTRARKLRLKVPLPPPTRDMSKGFPFGSIESKPHRFGLVAMKVKGRIFSRGEGREVLILPLL